MIIYNYNLNSEIIIIINIYIALCFEITQCWMLISKYYSSWFVAVVLIDILIDPFDTDNTLLCGCRFAICMHAVPRKYFFEKASELLENQES